MMRGFGEMRKDKTTFERSYEALVRHATWQRATAAFVMSVILLVVYFDYVEPLEHMGGGLRHLDVRYGVGYSPRDVIVYFDTLGSEGRAFYAKTTLFDTVWPLCIALTGALWAPLVFRNRLWVLLAAFSPVMFGLLDVVENCGIWLMLFQYPDVSAAFARTLNVLTLLKQAMIPGWAIIVPALPVIFLWQVLTRRSVFK
jgi:hypothetical protein